ncbi:MAG: hypothetical protein RRB13_10000 [bacterium]|nr:hypothetical protein [bacterium]
MAHQYSVEIQNFIGELIQKAQAEMMGLDEGSEARIRAEGRLEEAQFFRDHLTKNYDLKTQKYY